MLAIAGSLSAILLCFAAIHAACAAWAMFWKAPHHRSSYRPAAAVILAVRGCDPTLRATLLGLIRQEYDPLQIRIVVDHPNDEAWALVHAVIEEDDSQGRCTVETLRLTETTCGLKCAAIAQAARSLQDVAVIATIDADVVPHSNWLSELVAPLEDDRVGVATGNHWFEPSNANCGSLVRSLWNAGALIPTAFFANPWGGSLAMRIVDVQQSGLIEAWEYSAVDDGPIRMAFGRQGRRIVFLPNLIMVNRESCSLRFCWRYMSRILTWSRVYEPTFAWTVAHLAVNFLPWLAGIVLLFVALLQAQWYPGMVMLGGLLAHSTLMWCAYLLIRLAVVRLVNQREEPLARLGLWRSLKLWLLTPVALGAYGSAVIRALTSRYISWRGIWYYVMGRSQVVRLNYHPYARSSDLEEGNASL